MDATILLVSASARAEDCATFLSRRINTAIEVVTNRRSALATLRRHEFQVVMVDAELATQYPDGADLFWQHAGLALPILFRMPAEDCSQLLREVRSGLARREREQQLARRLVSASLEADLKSSVTGILLESELALREPGISPVLERRLRHLAELASTLRDRLRPEGAV
ncbi:hypothetical protein [Terriglobus tenax]|uniref:hypothetical protein n=1 Tax=Terriglobus tenax TaxID=1111115 RepID=UPI0021E0A04C|nr:hypothetical protein [Terriglobus tenax]